MSLEAALDEEMRDVVALLEGRKIKAEQRQASRIRAASPGVAASPVRSMLDVGSDAVGPGRHASIAGTSLAGVSSPTGSTFSQQSAPVRSMLDYMASPPPTPGSFVSRPRRPSLGSSSPPAPNRGSTVQNKSPEDSYNFEMLPSIESKAMPLRVAQGGKKKVKPNAMATIFGDSASRRGDGRANSVSILGKSQSSVSPNPRPMGGRSQSPGGRMLNNNSMNLHVNPGTYVSDSGQVIDLASAYRRLSDAALLKSGGTLSNLPMVKGANPLKGEQLAPDGGMRLTKDYDQDEAVDSSDEESGSSEDEWSAERRRGRGRTRKGSGSLEDDGRPSVKSLLGAAEEERKTVNYRVRSLLDPEPSVTITGPGGEKLMPGRRGSIHPRTSFDAGSASGISTPMDSDEEQRRTDLTTAQRMTLTLSPVHSTPSAHRVIRQILRGDYRKYSLEAEQGLRRQRMYLVATDLSEEAAYALEWTIGTVLRDGDTLLAAYAVDEEVGTGSSGESGSIAIGEGAKVMNDAAAIVRTLSNQGTLAVPDPSRNARASSTDYSSPDGEKESGLDVSKMEKAERERYYAAEEITDRCVKLLRKTKLQARVVVEVFHCKSPKHMITEVIDHLEPTLVILGSRGRSALKGVLLGSFSNYLVTKSSVPVMVARKKLRKTSKLKRGNIRLSNMLQNPSGRKLEDAQIEKPSGRFSKT
ncbi:hypothetical protein EJ08DRAFT_665642 [Tothia fuscella]|uniref:UspA domain-containing protein n=1 Tax=Tothia fuscella TaxID=1048955 RepID=A0A9P4NG64_9PEZI|nr:hypothetical protein EJ08DRAFT_665642 [Tothia fuscella]